MLLLYSLHPTSSFPHINGSSRPSPLLTKTLFLPSFQKQRLLPQLRRTPSPSSSAAGATMVVSSLLETPVLWAARLCIFYALVKTGIAGSTDNPIVSAEMRGGDGEGGDLGFAKWMEGLRGTPEMGGSHGDGESRDLRFAKWMEGLRGRPDYKEASDKRKLVSKWHPTTKGTLKRSFRVPTKAEGSRLLKAIASLLSDDDHFVDATSHKGCQIRRQNAHGESVCCNNVRALFDELPTPHLVIEITAFPAGTLTDNDYVKAEKLERVLRSGSSI